MSRRHETRRTGRPGFAWLIVVVGGIFLLAAAFVLVRQGGDAGTPQIAVDQQQIDYGYVRYGDTRAIKIAVTNTGDGVLRFKEKPYIEVLEGC